VPVKMRHTITEQFIVHLVRIESLGKKLLRLGHVFEEAPPISCLIIGRALQSCHLRVTNE